MKAMLLCAGLGTRLRPVTDVIPKPLIPIFDLTVAEYSLSMLRDSGFTSVVINLHHLPQKFHETLGAERCGMSLEYTHEPEILDAVGGIRNALSLLDTDPIVVVNGDILLNIDLRAMLEWHKEKNPALTIATMNIPQRPELNVVGVRADGTVTNIRKTITAPGEPAGMEANIGVFIYKREILEKYAPPGKPFGFRDGIIPALAEHGETIAAFSGASYWNDIGEPGPLLDFHFSALDGKAPARCLRQITTCNRSNQHKNVSPHCYIGGDCDISENAEIGDYTVIGKGCVIGKGAKLTNCVVFPDSSIPANTEFNNCIVSGDMIVKRV